ncbi:hypothetical protein AVEN_39016-1 [Araneus ventricosus]|uniref:Uncharacterized protein n=1 Tax=Araneus ventricosus TaxID=182803 RepID=A0A4Y2DN54_ARAVE|nr:hypothetical protein AVEN_39016-1 [Araneus ventricosus]
MISFMLKVKVSYQRPLERDTVKGGQHVDERRILTFSHQARRSPTVLKLPLNIDGRRPEAVDFFLRGSEIASEISAVGVQLSLPITAHFRAPYGKVIEGRGMVV